MNNKDSRIIISVDSNTIFRTLLIGLGVFFLYYISDVLVIIFVSFIIVSAIAPVVDYLEKFRLPRTIITLVIYFLAVSGLVYSLSLLLPAVGEQLQQLAKNLPNYSNAFYSLQEKFQHLLGNREIVQLEKSQLVSNLGDRLSEGWWGIFNQAGSLIRGLLTFIAILSLSFYMNIQKKSVGSFLQAFIPRKHQEYAVTLMERIQQKMGYWLLGQMVLNIIIGVMVYLGLYLLKIPYALVLAIIAGMFEVIPYLGPIFSSLLGVAVAFSINPLTGLVVLVMYIFIQQFENHIIVPLVMKKMVGLNPVAVIIAMLVGAKLAGAFGLVLAIPITAVISVFVSDLIKEENQEREEAKAK